MNLGVSFTCFGASNPASLSPKLVLMAELFLVLTIFLLASSSGAQSATLLQSVKPAPPQLHQKLSHLRFYWHDIYSGRHPTAVAIARAATTNTSTTGFGSVSIIDDPLTLGPELTSKLVGRAQGLYACADQEEVGLIMAMNLAFVERKYNGSTLAVLGRNSVLSEVREMPIVGGSGLFRFATGYVHATTQWFDPKSGDATVEYNVYVIHY